MARLASASIISSLFLPPRWWAQSASCDSKSIVMMPHDLPCYVCRSSLGLVSLKTRNIKIRADFDHDNQLTGEPCVTYARSSWREHPHGFRPPPRPRRQIRSERCSEQRNIELYYSIYIFSLSRGGFKKNRARPRCGPSPRPHERARLLGEILDAAAGRGAMTTGTEATLGHRA